MTDPTSIEVVARPDPDLETAFVGGEAVLLNVETGAVYALNPSASAVWLLLDGVASVRAIADELSEFVPLPDDALRADVAAAIADFSDRGLLDDRPKSAATTRRPPTPFFPPPDP